MFKFSLNKGWCNYYFNFTLRIVRVPSGSPTQGKTLRLSWYTVLVECCVFVGISRGTCIYGTLTRTPKIIQKKKNYVEDIGFGYNCKQSETLVTDFF